MHAYRLNNRLQFALFLMISVLFFSAAWAQTIYEQYEEGSVGFDYMQLPFGGIQGSFLADGPVWNPDLSFPEGQTTGCGGGISGAVGDTTQAIAIGAVDNSNGTRDVAVVFITFPEGPAIGSYPVDTETMSAGFVWIDDVVNLTMPEEGDDYAAWFDALEANHKFGAISGTIHVSAVGTEGFGGTFTGTVGDPDTFTLLNVTNGEFQVTNVPMSAVPQAVSTAHLMAAPNPFNPQTTVKLSLEQAGPVLVGVFDVAGRRVATLHRGLLSQGDHQWVWSGLNDSGVPQSGGVYFCRAEGTQWHTTTKLVLVP